MCLAFRLRLSSNRFGILQMSDDIISTSVVNNKLFVLIMIDISMFDHHYSNV